MRKPLAIFALYEFLGCQHITTEKIKKKNTQTNKILNYLTYLIFFLFLVKIFRIFFFVVFRRKRTHAHMHQ